MPQPQLPNYGSCRLLGGGESFFFLGVDTGRLPIFLGIAPHTNTYERLIRLVDSVWKKLPGGAVEKESRREPESFNFSLFLSHLVQSVIFAFIYANMYINILILF